MLLIEKKKKTLNRKIQSVFIKFDRRNSTIFTGVHGVGRSRDQRDLMYINRELYYLCKMSVIIAHLVKNDKILQAQAFYITPECDLKLLITLLVRS